MASAGRILIMPKGNWDANTEYEMLDLVFHNGTSWLAKKNVVGIEPSADNVEYWHNMSDVNIVNNLEATESGGVLDARQGKVLNDKIEERAYGKIYKSTTSFRHALGTESDMYIGGILDLKIHANIDTLTEGFHSFENGGPYYGVLLQKASPKNYSGVIFSYNNNLLINFAYNDYGPGVFRVLAVGEISGTLL